LTTWSDPDPTISGHPLDSFIALRKTWVVDARDVSSCQSVKMMREGGLNDGKACLSDCEDDEGGRLERWEREARGSTWTGRSTVKVVDMSPVSTNASHFCPPAPVLPLLLPPLLSLQPSTEISCSRFSLSSQEARQEVSNVASSTRQLPTVMSTMLDARQVLCKRVTLDSTMALALAGSLPDCL
jgi:hypothetical protein